MNTNHLIQLVRDQVRRSTADLDRDGTLEMYIEEIPVVLSNRRARRQMGFFHGLGPGDVGRIVMNAGLNSTEQEFVSTLFHEFAHAVCHWVHGRGADTHGPKWKAIMVQLGQAPERCG